MFNKNDPLIGSVKQVMAENQVRRDVEKQLNEELGIHSKKALPFEHHAEYDALLEQRIAEAKEGSIPNTPKEKSLARLHGDPNRITHGDVLKGRGVVEEEGEETREGGAVRYNGRPVVSPTATRAGETSARRPPQEGPSASDRQALTNMIKKDVVKEEEQLDELSKKFLMKASDAAQAKGQSLAGKAPKTAKRKLDQANKFYNAATSGDYRYGPKGSGAKITRTMRKNDPYDDMEKHSPRDIKEEQIDEAGMNLKAFGKNANRDYPGATKSGGEIARGLKKGVKSASTDWLKNVSKNADKAADFSPAKLQGRMAKRELDKRMKNEEVEQLDEKAVSKAQQRFFGLVRGIQKGEAKGSDKAEKAAKEMSTKEVKKYAKTKQKGLPEKVDEDFDLDAVMEEIRANLGEEKFAALMAEQTPPPRMGSPEWNAQRETIMGRGNVAQRRTAEYNRDLNTRLSKSPELDATDRRTADRMNNSIFPVGRSEQGRLQQNVRAKGLEAGENADRGEAEAGANIRAMQAARANQPQAQQQPAPQARTQPQSQYKPQTATDLKTQVNQNPVAAPKGEGATGKKLADLGVSREQRRSDTFVKAQLGQDWKYGAGSKESNLALAAKLGKESGSGQGSDARPEPAASRSQTAAAGAALTAANRQATSAPTTNQPNKSAEQQGLESLRRYEGRPATMNESLESTIRRVLKD